jgi:transcriptional regulator with XRE-family HTH domain
MDLATAIKGLRAQYGDSQQAFAARMGLSIRAIANYEKDRVPTLSVLAKLAIHARLAKRPDLQDVFEESVANQFGLKDNFVWTTAGKRARGAFMLAAPTSLERKRGAFLLLNVIDGKLASVVNLFSMVIEDYLYPTGDLRQMSHAQAEELLFNFQQSVVACLEALPAIERTRTKK